MNEIAAVKIDDVVFKYFKNGKRNIIDHLSLEIKSGTVTVITGSSGCGKSTLAAVISGLYPENGGFLEGGSIELFGQKLSELSVQQRAKLLSMMFQNPDLQFCMDTVRKEMIFCLENIAVNRDEMCALVEDAARVFKIENLLDKKIHLLSGGEKQKVSLACLYLLKSRIIILDESFANIDEDQAIELRSIISEICRKGTSVIAIDHKVGFWIDTADEIILLTEGAKILQRGINKNNIETFRNLFKDEGIFYPEKENSEKSSDSASSREVPADSLAIALKDFSIYSDKKRKNCLIDNSNLCVKKGQMTALLGHSGSGKTTAFYSILKQHPYTGNVIVNGVELSKIKAKNLFSQIGIVFQNPGNQFVSQNVFHEVEDGIRMWNKKMTDSEIAAKAEELLKFFDLYRYRKFSPYMLSQGQQRRLAVLSVLAGNQKILLLDEPTYGQDFKSTQKIMTLLRKKMEEEGLTVVFVTHDRELAFNFADDVYELKNKRFEKYERN